MKKDDHLLVAAIALIEARLGVPKNSGSDAISDLVLSHLKGTVQDLNVWLDRPTEPVFHQNPRINRHKIQRMIDAFHLVIDYYSPPLGR